MKFVKTGADAPIAFDLTDIGFVSSTVSYSLVDELGTVLMGATSVPGYAPGATEVSFVIPGVRNTLAPGVFTGAREVRLTVYGAGSPLPWPAQLTSSYALELADPLVVPQRSFLSRLEADMLAADSWETATVWATYSERAKVAALRGAFEKIAPMSLYWQGEPCRVEGMSASTWASLNDTVKRTLRRAQLLDAIDALAAQSTDIDPNIESMKVGESTTTFRQAQPASMGVGQRARALLRRLSPPMRLVRG